MGDGTYKGLHSQSRQRVLEELAEAFNSWHGKRTSDSRANPPGYRKNNYYDNDGNRVHEEHPRSTVTWKQNGIKHDSENTRVRLSKGANHKEHPKRGGGHPRRVRHSSGCHCGEPCNKSGPSTTR